MTDVRFETTSTTTADPEKASTGYAASETGLQHVRATAKEERRILFKLDRVILPLTALLYLSAYLDRGNLGNAKLQGLYAGLLDSSDTKYSVVLCIFYVTYISLSIPGTLLAKAILPSYSIALGALIWSIAATGMAGAQSFGAVITCRLFVGIGEALFGQAVTFHYSLWYKKDEISKRLALFIGAGVLSGAFGGLIAYGTSQIKSSIANWRILFLIEGCPSIILAICIFFFLPSRPDKSNYITEDERTVVHTRLNADSLGEGHTGIDWNGVKRALTDWKTYVVSIMYSAMNLTLGSVTGFLPTIIKGLGHTDAAAQLFTVPPYAVAFVTMYLISYFSDRAKSRGPFVAGVFVISIVGWLILLLELTDNRVRYFACICIVIGGYNNIPLIMSWQSNNTGSQSQRAVSLGMLNSVGQCLSILASFSFPDSEEPRYIKGISLNIAFNALGIFIAMGMSLYYRLENARRDRVEGGRPPKGEVMNVVEEHDFARGFRYVV
ncbi:MFS general substrate transporter [Stereum hirsutum FP-91666 SS1]|uniref:MFS general substrate transporter n=1 Tax=Stereum hirsutum (strain FP-91666) TaxID=721885 RepID=UPI000444A723|nr:MFS general substrate transporter [Stereum hirsutum FP-91666 SS1]EIM83806.1 MFS general substrate transporter [Stereum hirsutum FP-91666 SS1]